MDDAELVRQVLQGNLGAYVDLVRRYTPQIAALCRAHVRRPDVVEDLVKETFYRGLNHLADLHERFGSWELALAAYDMGYGRLTQRVQELSTNDYWTLSLVHGAIPDEALTYVPKVLARQHVLREPGNRRPRRRWYHTF